MEPREQSFIARAFRQPLNRALVLAAAGMTVVTGCFDLDQTFEENPEAAERRVTALCFADNPDCSPLDVSSGQALAAIGTGNSIAVENIPEMCLPGKDVEPTMEKDIPFWLPYAIMAVEDSRFCEHDGVDVKGLVRAFLETLAGNTQGASTIDMQTVRLLAPELLEIPDLQRKLAEITTLAKELNERFSKTEIMKMYVNLYPAGRGAYGIEAFMRIHFGTTAEQATLDQSAAFAAILQNPGKYEGSSDPQENRDADILLYNERNEVLRAMFDQGYIDKPTLDSHLKKPLGRIAYSRFNDTRDFTGAKMVGAEFVTQQIISDIAGKLPEGVSIYDIKAINTTINRNDQLALARAYNESQFLLPANAQFGAVLVDETGATVASIPGLYDENGPNIDLLRAYVSGGSQDKPYFVLPLLLNGMGPYDMVPDPAYFEWLNFDGRGNNYTPTEKASRCPEDQCSLHESIARSSNWGLLTALKAYEDLGIPVLAQGYAIMDVYGLRLREPAGPAGIISGEIPPLNRALGAMQLHGLQGRVIPETNRGRLYNSVVLQNGEKINLFDSTAVGQQVVPPEIANMVTDMLASAVEYGTARGLQSVSQKVFIVAKTGTPQNNTAPGINGYFELNGKKYAFAVVMRDPDGLSNLGGDADGGKAPTQLASAVVENLIVD